MFDFASCFGRNILPLVLAEISATRVQRVMYIEVAGINEYQDNIYFLEKRLSRNVQKKAHGSLDIIAMQHSFH